MSWQVKDFGSITENLDSKRIPLKSSDRNVMNKKYPYYGASGIIDYVDNFIFDGKYLLISEDGANLLARSTPIAFISSGKFWVNNHAHIVKAKKDITIEKYLEYFLNSIDLSIYITGSAQPKLNQKALNSISVPLPPLPQQQKIANILNAAEALRQNDKALLAKYDELTSALFLDMFGDPVTNPKGWEKVKMGLVTNMKAGKFIAASEIYSENDENLFSCYGGNGLRGFVKSYTHDGDFVLIGRQGALCGNVKVTDGKFHATEHAIVCSPKKQYKTLWLYYLLKMINLNRFATGAAQPGLNVGTLVELEIILASYNLQNQFAERVAIIEEQKTIVQKSLEKSEELFNSLLQKAFKGEL